MKRTERLNLRVTPDEQELLRRAAEASGQTVTDYILSRVLARAHDDLIDRESFNLDAASWSELRARLDAPPTERPGMTRLLARPRPWPSTPTEPNEPTDPRAQAIRALRRRGPALEPGTVVRIPFSAYKRTQVHMCAEDDMVTFIIGGPLDEEPDDTLEPTDA